MQRMTARPVAWAVPAKSTRRKSARRGGRRPDPYLRRRVRRLAGVGLIMLVRFAGAVWLVIAGTIGESASRARAWAVARSAEAGITVREILVEGRRRTPQDELRDALGDALGVPMLTVDPAAIRRRLERIAWVKSASVVRRFPDVLYLRLSERRPMAIWQRQGMLALVDRAGEVIAVDDIAAYSHLPVVVGDDAPGALPSLLAVTGRDPELWRRVEAAVRVGARRWNLRLDNGVDVRLPETDLVTAWSRLGAWARAHDLLERDLTVVDLRLPDRLVIGVRPEPAETQESRTAEGEDA